MKSHLQQALDILDQWDIDICSLGGDEDRDGGGRKDLAKIALVRKHIRKAMKETA